MRELAEAKARCEAARWPEQHSDSCQWCALFSGVEYRLQEQWHEELCACQMWPESCVTYGDGWGERAPSTWPVADVLDVAVQML